MTQDEMIEMARESGLETQNGFSESVFYFAKLVAEKKVEGMVVMTPDEFKSVWDKAQAEEREACAMTAENTNVYDRYSPEDTIADAIRARGNYQKGQTD